MTVPKCCKALTTSVFCGQGFPGPSASLHVFDRGTGRTVRLEVEAPELENSYYIYEVVWYDALQVLVRLMNRYDQQLSIRVQALHLCSNNIQDDPATHEPNETYRSSLQAWRCW